MWYSMINYNHLLILTFTYKYYVFKNEAYFQYNRMYDYKKNASFINKLKIAFLVLYSPVSKWH